MRVMSIYFQGGGVQYHRALIPNAALERNGVEIVQLDREKDLDDYKAFEKFLLKHVKGCDVIHAGYTTDQDHIRLLLSARNYADIPLITDIDDDIYNVPSYNLAYKHYHGGAQERRMARMQLRVSDGVSASTAPLVSVLENDSTICTQLPNCVEPSDWDYPPRHETDDGVRVLFVGNVGRYGDLIEVKDAVHKLLRECPNVRMFFMGCVPDWAVEWMSDSRNASANRCFSIRYCDVKHYQAILRNVNPDIIINPVQMNIFNKSKSHIKAFDAAMTNAAFVCTDWPTHDEIPSDCAIKLDNSTTQWETALVELARDASLRERLATRLKTWVCDTQTIDKHVHKWVELYERAIAKGPITDLSEIVRPGIGGVDGMASRRTAPSSEGRPERRSAAGVRD